MVISLLGAFRWQQLMDRSNQKDDVPFWAAKIDTSNYLKQVNENGKVLFN